MEAIKIESLNSSVDWLDYSNLSSFARCPRLYYWSCIRNIGETGSKAALINGEAYHEAKAQFYQAIKDGGEHDDAVEIGINALKPIMAKIVEDDTKRNISVAEKTMRQYFNMWKDDPYKTIDIEVPFAIDMGDFIFVGRIDRVVESIFGKAIEETKTTTIVGTRWRRRVYPNMQIDGYVSAYKILSGEMPFGGILDVIPVTTFEKVHLKGHKPFRLPAPRVEEDTVRWAGNVQSFWKTISNCKKDNFFPQNTENCVPLLGFGCKFTNLCERVSNPFSQAEIDLGNSYKIEKWAPFDELLGDGNARDSIS